MQHAEYILVVEDDAGLARIMLRLLKTAGYTASAAGDGQKALDAVAERMPALILLDMLMPVMNGWEFAREFRSRYGRAAPIVVLTAAENARQRGTEVDADEVLSKPCDLDTLLGVIRTLAGQPQSGPAC